MILKQTGEEEIANIISKIAKTLNLNNLLKVKKKGYAHFIFSVSGSSESQNNCSKLSFYLCIQTAFPNRCVNISKTLREDPITVSRSFIQQLLTQ